MKKKVIGFSPFYFYFLPLLLTLDEFLLLRDDLSRDLDLSVLVPDLILELLDDFVGLEEFLGDALSRVLASRHQISLVLQIRLQADFLLGDCFEQLTWPE